MSSRAGRLIDSPTGRPLAGAVASVLAVAARDGRDLPRPATSSRSSASACSTSSPSCRSRSCGASRSRCRWPSGSMLAFNFFFLPPVHTFTLADERELVLARRLLGTAVVVSELAARARRRAADGGAARARVGAARRHRDRSPRGPRRRGGARSGSSERSAAVLGVPPAAHRARAGARQRRRRGLVSARGRRGAWWARIYDARAGSEPAPARAALPACACRAARGRGRPGAARAPGSRGRDARDGATPSRPPLLRAVSHDLRSPLTAISTAIGALRNDELELDDADRASCSRRSPSTPIGSSGSSRTSSTSPARGRCCARPRRSSGARPARRPGARPARRGGPRRGRRCRRTSPLVHVDAVQIQRVLANLIENALKFSPPDSPRARAHHARRARRRSSVSSTMGPGCRRTSSSASSSRSTAAGGVRARARARPRDRARVRRGQRRARLGRVEAGQGATFALALPVVECPRSSRHERPRVLVVDDEPQILRALRTTLRGAGYEVDTAATAEEALAAAALVRPRR